MKKISDCKKKFYANKPWTHNATANPCLFLASLNWPTAENNCPKKPEHRDCILEHQNWVEGGIIDYLFLCLFAFVCQEIKQYILHPSKYCLWYQLLPRSYSLRSSSNVVLPIRNPAGIDSNTCYVKSDDAEQLPSAIIEEQTPSKVCRARTCGEQKIFARPAGLWQDSKTCNNSPAWRASALPRWVRAMRWSGVLRYTAFFGVALPSLCPWRIKTNLFGSLLLEWVRWRRDIVSHRRPSPTASNSADNATWPGYWARPFMYRDVTCWPAGSTSVLSRSYCIFRILK